MGANAQTSVPTFVASQVLTADQMNQSARTGVPVFANTTTRNAAFDGTGEKILAEGQLCYLEDSNVVQFYDGANWLNLAPLDSPNFTTNLKVNTTVSYTASGISNPLVSLAGTTSAAGYGASIWSANATGPNNLFLKSRGATIGTHAAVASGDNLGRLIAAGSDGTNFVQSSEIRMAADSAPSSGIVPGRVLFLTANASGTLTEALRADSLQNVGINGGAGGDQLRVTDPAASGYSVHSFVSDANYAGSAYAATATRAANAAYNFFVAVSDGSGTPDTEFALKGDGNGYCDGAWTGGGADYAEYFEWLDGNPNNEDRRGMTVVFEGDKVRLANDNEQPVGAVSSNPSFVSDAAWNHWAGKYILDEFGNVKTEPAIVCRWYDEENVAQTRYLDDCNPEELPENYETQETQRPIINPEFDETIRYVPRSQRKEWAPIGFIGKIKIRENQPVNANWILLKQENVFNLWFVK